MKYIKGDLLLESTGIIVHGVNMQGVMNAGIAKLIRQKYPRVYSDYMLKISKSKLGDNIVTKINEKLYIVSAVTQRFYGRDKNKVYVDYEAIRNSFNVIWYMQEEFELAVKFPKIGCGLAGGDWSVIEGIINECLGFNNGTCFLI